MRDFSHIWEAYTTFEDSLVAAKMDMLGDQDAVQDPTLDVDLEEETAGIFSPSSSLLFSSYYYYLQILNYLWRATNTSLIDSQSYSIRYCYARTPTTCTSGISA